MSNFNFPLSVTCGDTSPIGRGKGYGKELDAVLGSPYGGAVSEAD